MVCEKSDKGCYLLQGKGILPDDGRLSGSSLTGILQNLGVGPAPVEAIARESARKNTISYGILEHHNRSDSMDRLKIRFDALASHDITYVGIVQTARASGMESFPMPYVLTNCHNSLAAVGGTINEDDHAFGLSAAVKYGGIYVPPHQAVIHQYMREMQAGCGKMILGSDSHTRYGALGTMAVGEGGPELVKQLLNRTWDIPYPPVVAVYLEGAPVKGVGPQDVALAIIGEVFKEGFIKNKVMEFVGPGIDSLSVDFRNGIDVMTTETTCLSSIWKTDDAVRDYLKLHGREEEYRELSPGEVAYYDGLIKIDLSTIEPMIALPFHPSHVYPIREFLRNAPDILEKIDRDARKQFGRPDLETGLPGKVVRGEVHVDQGIIAGCAGGSYENLAAAADILDGRSIGNGSFSLSLYPASQPIYLEMIKSGIAGKMVSSGALLRSAFCGPCFGAGDVPVHRGLSIRHTTRNFPYREGAKPGEGQIAATALMDARSIAATALNRGVLTPATEVSFASSTPVYSFDKGIYENRVKDQEGRPASGKSLVFGPNIKDWPRMIPLPENLLLQFAAVIGDAVTTTDELIPSGETSSFRSNPLRLAEFTLSRRDPAYVERAKKIYRAELDRREGTLDPEMQSLLETISRQAGDCRGDNTGFGSLIFARKPGDGSAREQAASCQKVLGGWANLALEYATKRYRSNMINWGMVPLLIKEPLPEFAVSDFLYIPRIRPAVEEGRTEIAAFHISPEGIDEIPLYWETLTPDEREIILSGCLINHYAEGH